MTEITVPFEDEQAAIEYALLWDDVKDIVGRNAAMIGIREVISDGYACTGERSKMVLQSEPVDEHMVQLWALPTRTELIGQVTLSFQNPHTRVESWCYELIPNKMTYYGRDMKQTTFTRDEIAELRADLQEIVWDPTASTEAASEAIFFDV